MRDSDRRRGSSVSLRKAIRRPVAAAFAAAVAVVLMGTGVASADTGTGFVLTITCDGVTTTVVSPTGPAAASQDVSSTGVVILAYGALFAPGTFPVGKVVLCDIHNLTTGNSFEDIPFLVTGPP
jgi:hypothetical protein